MSRLVFSKHDELLFIRTSIQVPRKSGHRDGVLPPPKPHFNVDGTARAQPQIKVDGLRPLPIPIADKLLLTSFVQPVCGLRNATKAN